MIRRPPRSTLSSSSAASDVYKRQPPCPAAPPGAHDPDHWTRPVRHCVRDVFHWPCSPRAGPFPPPPPPPVPRACSAASQVLRACLTSRGRASRDYHLSVPLTARPTLLCHPANHPARGITTTSRATTRPPGSRAWSLSYVPGISDRAGPTSDKRYRRQRCCLPMFGNSSAP